ncbi:transposable element-related [Holotrichia oblita]|uniref:Transposable element-related n=1 Tax=Holotrichia oblita TaxID=644536 RepID=A0ACB9SK36_HOLOL|nr:transposable element-related [Holotrichia oblita]
MLKLSECDKVLILSKLEEGWSIRYVAGMFNINKATVLNVKKKWEENRSVKRKEGSGRPRISNQQQDEVLLDYLRENPFRTARDAVYHTNFPGSWSTACRRINNSELKNYTSAKKELLAVENKQSRMLFSLNYIYRGQNFWESVVFSDEKIFQSSHDGRVNVYRSRNKIC